MNKDNVAKWADDHIIVLGRGKAASEATKAALVAKLERDEAEESAPEMNSAETNKAKSIANRLTDEARAYLADPDANEAPDALAVTETIGARILITYGGPTVEAIIETTRDESGIAETTGRIEWSHGSETAAHPLTGEEAADIWEAYGLEGLANEARA